LLVLGNVYLCRCGERQCADTIGTVPVSWLAISSAEILIYFQLYGSNFVKQHSETVMVWKYQNADCSLRKKTIVSSVIIFGIPSFPIALVFLVKSINIKLMFVSRRSYDPIYSRRTVLGRTSTASVTTRYIYHRYDTIRDAILTCARKPTWVSLIYRREPTTKK